MNSSIPHADDSFSCGIKRLQQIASNSGFSLWAYYAGCTTASIDLRPSRLLNKD